MTRKHLIISINIIVCSAFFALGLLIAARAQAQVPSLPCQIYGKVLNESGIPVQNAKVTAFVGGNLVATSETDTQGQYGIAPQTLIISDKNGDFAGKTIEFKVNGVSIPQITQCQSGALTQLNITVSSALDNKSPVTIDQKSQGAFVDISTTTASSSRAKDENEVINYTTPIFHIKKHKRLSEYTPAHAPLYPHSKIIGVIAGLIASAVFFWVCIQNYLYAKKQNP